MHNTYHIYIGLVISGLVFVILLTLLNLNYTNVEEGLTDTAPAPTTVPETAPTPAPAPAPETAPETDKEKALASKETAKTSGRKKKQSADKTSSETKETDQAVKKASDKKKKDAGEADIKTAGERIEVAQGKIGVGASKLEKAKKRTKPEGFQSLGNDFELPLEPYLGGGNHLVAFV